MSEDYIYPVELIKNTENRIKKQMDGNGIEQKNVKITVKRQGKESFTAKTSFSFDYTVETNQTNGKQVQGRLIDTGTLQSEVQKTTAEISENGSLNTLAIETIKKMPLGGFGVENSKTPFPSQKIQLTEHIKCSVCQGQGQSQCKTCAGKGRMLCNICHGYGLKPCQICNGKGQIQNGTNTQICGTCQGRREVFCYQCHGQKTILCTYCQSKGYTTCTQCHGQGANSVHATITPTIKVHSDIMFAEIHSDPKNMIAKIGAVTLAKGGHISPVIGKKPPTEKVERAYYEDEPSENDNAVYYDISAPWAVLEVSINNETDNVYLIGAKGAIANGGKFMDKIVQPATQLLQMAANGQGYVAGLLKDACNYRVSRETLLAVSRMGPKKAMKDIHKRYPIGLSVKTIQTMAILSYQSLKRVTRRPRYIGLCLGLIGAVGINYLWFMDGLRSLTLPYNEMMRYAMDGIPFIAGLLLTFFSIKGAGYFAFQTVMKNIGIKSKKMPAMGKAGFYGLLGNILMWGLGFSSLFVPFH